MAHATPIRRVTPKRPRVWPVSWLVVAVLLLVVWALSGMGWRSTHPALRVWFFDVGQGDATLIETPHGQQILIDGGPDHSVLGKLSSVMWPWDRSLDAVVVTHPDADHIIGLIPVFELYEVERIYETGVRGGTSVITELVEVMQEEQAEVVTTRAGQSFEIDGVRFDVLWPTAQEVQTMTERNDTSIVLKVTYGEQAILLTGDAQAEVEDDFALNAGDVDVYKVGHHGSKTSSSWELLQWIKPEIAVISDGVENRYGHPHPIVLSRLQEMGAQIWRTDLDGDILVETDGRAMKVQPALLPF